MHEIDTRRNRSSSPRGHYRSGRNEDSSYRSSGRRYDDADRRDYDRYRSSGRRREREEEPYRSRGDNYSSNKRRRSGEEESSSAGLHADSEEKQPASSYS